MSVVTVYRSDPSSGRCDERLTGSEAGAICFDDPLIELTPRMTRSEFLSSEAGRHATTVAENEPWHSWVLPPSRNGPPIECTVHFCGERLEMITLCNFDEQFGRDWSEYSEAKEARRKAWHDRWLRECCNLRPGTYRWGEILSTFGPDEPLGDLSTIIVRYHKKATEGEEWSVRRNPLANWRTWAIIAAIIGIALAPLLAARLR